jgi:protein-S-isoprenylcysteine O-methyltransferase Ste14
MKRRARPTAKPAEQLRGLPDRLRQTPQTWAWCVGLFIVSIRTFRAAGTPVPGNQPTSAIVRTGPYSFSRNPIYLAFSLFQLGLSV